MINKLNLVFENWEIGTDEPECNLKNSFKESMSYYNLMNIIIDYTNYEKYRLEEVKNYPDENFYFLVSPFDGLEQYLSNDNFFLTQKIIDYLKIQDNLYLILINDHESESESFLCKLESKCLEIGLNPNKIFVVNNNSLLQEYKEKMNLSLNVYSITALFKWVSKCLYGQLPFDFVEKKEGFFLCHNRRPHNHRFAIIYMLLKSGLINDTDWSFIGMKYDVYVDNIFTPEELRLLTPEINYVNNLKIKKSKYEQDKTWFDNNYINCIEQNTPNLNYNTIYEKNTYINTYVNIVTETTFFGNVIGNVIHITEKSFKPFFFLQFPLILASQNHVKELKKIYNFDLFEDIINYDYDSEPNPRKRFFMFFNELKRIHENKSNIIEFYSNNKERFMENQRKVIEFKDKNFDHKFFDSLIHFKNNKIND